MRWLRATPLKATLVAALTLAYLPWTLSARDERPLRGGATFGGEFMFRNDDATTVVTTTAGVTTTETPTPETTGGGQDVPATIPKRWIAKPGTESTITEAVSTQVPTKPTTAEITASVEISFEDAKNIPDAGANMRA